MAMGPGVEAPVVLIQMKGNQARLEFTIQGLTAVQAYDGKSAWEVMPFMGKKDPELMSADEAKDIQEMADIGGPLFDVHEPDVAVIEEHPHEPSSPAPPQPS
jgi:hypothetical protein